MERRSIPISRPGRSPGEQQTRTNQPGRYRRAWTRDVAVPPAGLRLPAYQSIDEVPSELRERAAHKLQWVARFVREGCPRGKLHEYAVAVAGAAGVDQEAVPPYTTLRDWAKLYAHWGLVGLCDKVRCDAGHSRTVSDEFGSLALACVIGLKHGVAQALAFLARALPPEATLPKYASLSREIARFKRRNPHVMSMVREGITGWRNRFRMALPGIDYPAGHRYAVDSTTCDVWIRVRDVTVPGFWRAGRCVLTVVEDVGSRSLLTFNLSLVSVDSGIALGTMRRAVMPDLNYPGLPTVGLPEEVVVDCGPEHLGDFNKSLSEAGVKVRYTTPGTPEDNGPVERVIGTIKTEVFSNLPGFTESYRVFNKYAKVKKENKKNLENLKYQPYRSDVPIMSLLTLEELELRLNAWATVYNARGHSSLKANSQILQEVMNLDHLLNQEAAA